ncbi:MAG TPA: hypothetical protein VFE36_14130 [Candidatus Baltobacteraceae bacterium]|nr:hypothetical protein [Candidatus Baltobacteraceae bacterium]
MPWYIPAQYCARQGATAYLEMWALLLVLAGAAILTRRTSRFLAGTFVVFAALTGILGTSMFYGCSVSAPAEQGLGTNLPAATYGILRCFGHDVGYTAYGWVLFVLSCGGAIALFVFGIIRWKQAGRALAIIGAALLAMAAFAVSFFLLFAFSWCASSRLF